jgi:hypothetical protein
MKAALFALASLSLASSSQAAQREATQNQAAPAPDAVIQVDFSNPALSPSEWTLTIQPQGGAHFRSQMGKPQSAGPGEIETPGVDRDVHLSPQFARRIFDLAQHHRLFNEPCESHLKVAFQGWKTLTYTGPQGQGTCTFNFSKDKEIQDIGDSLEAVATTILEGARLELLLQHDRLGLDEEMGFLAQAAEDGRAQQLCAIRDILERLVQDDAVLERVRKRARALLAQGST